MTKYILVRHRNGRWVGNCEESFSMGDYKSHVYVYNSATSLRDALSAQRRNLQRGVAYDVYDVDDPKCPVVVDTVAWMRERHKKEGFDKFRARNAPFREKGS